MSNLTPLTVIWTDFNTAHERNVSGAEDALNLLSHLRKTHIGPPPMVEFFESQSGIALAIGIGRAETVVTFQYSTNPPYYISRGKHHDEGSIIFCYGNEDTEYLSRNRIPINVGMDALRFFVLHRDKPPKVDWERL